MFNTKTKFIYDNKTLIIILLFLNLVISLTLSCVHTKAINQNLPDDISIQQIKNEKITTEDFILNLIRKNEPFEQIVNKYFSLPQEKIAAIINNNRIFKVKSNKKISNNPNELKNVNQIKKIIKDKESEYISNLTTM